MTQYNTVTPSKKTIFVGASVLIFFALSFGAIQYVTDNICFLMDTSSIEYMNDPILQKNKKVLVVRKKILEKHRTVEEGDLIVYEKFGKKLIKRVASTGKKGYFNEWNTDFFQYKNVRIPKSNSGTRKKYSTIENNSYGGVMELNGITMRPNGIVVVSDEVDNEGRVRSYDVLKNFVGWAYPFNMKTLQVVVFSWMNNKNIKEDIHQNVKKTVGENKDGKINKRVIVENKDNFTINKKLLLAGEKEINFPKKCDYQEKTNEDGVSRGFAFSYFSNNKECLLIYLLMINTILLYQKPQILLKATLLI